MPPEDIDMEYQEQMSDEERELEEKMKDWVRVVRCKDCKHYWRDVALCAKTQSGEAPDDYCSYGERKGETK